MMTAFLLWKRQACEIVQLLNHLDSGLADRLIQSLVMVARQHALVESLRQRQGGAVAQQDTEEGECGA
jgi:hypothetical protein